jgi:hypothetical protein
VLSEDRRSLLQLTSSNDWIMTGYRLPAMQFVRITRKYVVSAEESLPRILKPQVAELY